MKKSPSDAKAGAATTKSAPAKKPAPVARRNSKVWILLLALGGGAAALCAGGIVLWLAWGWLDSPGRIAGKDGLQAKSKDDKPVDKNKGKVADAADAKHKFEPANLDTSYVTKDFCAAVIVSPSAALQAPLIRRLVPPPWLTMATQEIGVDPQTIERVMVLVETPPAVADPPVQPVLADLAKYRPKAEKALKGHTFDLRSAIFSKDGKWLLTGSGDRQVRIHDPRTGALIRALPRLDDSVRGIALSPDKKSLAIASWDKTVRLWSFQTDSARILPTGTKEEFETVAISHDGKTLAAGGKSKAIYVFDLPEGALRHTLPGHTGSVTHLAFPRDGKTLVSYGLDNEVRLWDPVSGKALGAPVKQAFGDAMAISPDGKYVALGGFDNAIHLHELATGKEIQKLNTQAGVRSLDFRFDGKVLAAGGGGFQKDGEVTLWQIPEGILLHDLHMHKKEVYAVAFSPDGSQLVSAGQDDYAQVWSLSPTAGGGSDPLPVPMAFIVRLKNPKDAKAVFAKATQALGPFQEKVVDGKTLLVADNSQAPGSAYIASDGTIVIARLETLRKMIAGKKETSPLIERLAKLPAGEAQIVVSIEPLRKILTDAAKEMKDDLPPPLARAVPLIEQLRFVELSLNSQRNPLAHLSLDMADGQSANALHAALKESVALGKDLYLKARESFAFEVPSEILGLADQLNELEPTKNGTNVALALPKPVLAERSPFLIASAGFNDAKGMHADRIPGSPYPLETKNRLGGMGEPGWKGPWAHAEKIAYQSKDVFEGDGAAFIVPEASFLGRNFGRAWAEPTGEPFKVTQYVKIPANGHVIGYISKLQAGQNLTGPLWQAHKGKFLALNGNEQGGGDSLDTGYAIDPGKWHKVMVVVYPAKRKWEFWVDDKKFDAQLGFRFPTSQIDHVDYLTEAPGGVYLDAIVVEKLRPGETLDVAKENLLPHPKDVVAKVDPPKKKPIPPETKNGPKEVVRPADWPPTRVASAGFNNAKGMNSTAGPGVPHMLDKFNVPGGDGEFGWAGPWNGHEKIIFQSKEVFEGDGAAHVLPRIPKSYGMNLHRRLSAPLTAPFEVTQYIKIPANGDIKGYITHGVTNNNAGPVWFAGGGYFGALDGDEKGGGKNLKFGKADPAKWHKVTVVVDPQKRKWDFAVDDQQVRAGIGFRFPIQSFQTVDYLSEGPDGFYLDAVVIETKK